MPRKTDGIEIEIHPGPKKGEDGKPLLYVRPAKGHKKTFKELEEWVNDPLGDDVQCLEIEKKVYSKPSDDQVWQQIKELTGVTNSTTFQLLEGELKRNILRILKDSGASHRQLERLTGVGRGLIQKL